MIIPAYARAIFTQVPGKQPATQRLLNPAKAVNSLARRIRNTSANVQGVKVVLIGGPSGTGKTYFAEMLAQALPPALVLEMDRWRGSLGKLNLSRAEFLQVLGLDQFNADLATLLRTGRLDDPPRLVQYQTLTQPREYETEPLHLGNNKTVIVNGTVALHEQLAAFGQLKLAFFANEGLRQEHRLATGRSTQLQGPKYGFSNECARNADQIIFLERHNDRYFYRVFE